MMFVFPNARNIDLSYNVIMQIAVNRFVYFLQITIPVINEVN